MAILGAAGRDFHVFNVFFRSRRGTRVVAFAVTQLPGLGGRRYPPDLSGPLYPHGVPIYRVEGPDDLAALVRSLGIDEVVLAYSDLTYAEVGAWLGAVLGAGASFRVLGPEDTYVETHLPVVAVTAARTGSGKSTISRAIAAELMGRGLRPVVLRHPMPYGDLRPVYVYRSRDDLSGLTLEEREEYEQYVEMGLPVLSGVDYGEVVRAAEGMGDVVLWDGGNNDFPMVRPSFMVVAVDAMRPHDVASFPGEANVRMADHIIITKADRAKNIGAVIEEVRRRNGRAPISLAVFRVRLVGTGSLMGKRVLVVEDAPTVTHGGLPHGAGYVAAVEAGAEVVDPRRFAVGALRKAYDVYPHMGPVLPSLGYTPEQIRDLEETVRRMDVDAVVLGTPARLEDVARFDKPVFRATWEIEVVEGPTIRDIVRAFLEDN